MTHSFARRNPSPALSPSREEGRGESEAGTFIKQEGTWKALEGHSLSVCFNNPPIEEAVITGEAVYEGFSTSIPASAAA